MDGLGVSSRSWVYLSIIRFGWGMVSPIQGLSSNAIAFDDDIQKRIRVKRFIHGDEVVRND